MPVFIFLLSAIAFLLFFFAAHLLYIKNGNLLLNRLLSVQLLTRFGQICVFLLIASGHVLLSASFLKIWIPLFFAAPACSYLYVRCFVRAGSGLKKTDIFHFLPFLLAVIHRLIPAGDTDWQAVTAQILTGGHLSVNESTGLFPSVFYNYGLGMLTAGYLAASWYIVLSSGLIKKSPWNIHKIWLFFYLSTSTFFKLLGFAAVLYKARGVNYANNPAFLVVSCLVLLFMMIFILYQPGILYGYILIKRNKAETSEPAGELVNRKIAGSGIKMNRQQQELYAATITNLMEDEKPFLSTDYQIIHLAQTLQIPVHHCSQTINQYFGKNFRDWLNGYRIRYFIKQYPLVVETMTIESVAFQSGFKNITTFYNAFKKETGQMPTAYFEKELMN